MGKLNSGSDSKKIGKTSKRKQKINEKGGSMKKPKSIDEIIQVSLEEVKKLRRGLMVQWYVAAFNLVDETARAVRRVKELFEDVAKLQAEAQKEIDILNDAFAYYTLFIDGVVSVDHRKVSEVTVKVKKAIEILVQVDTEIEKKGGFPRRKSNAPPLMFRHYRRRPARLDPKKIKI